jgi:hypothetical protein
MTVTFIFYVNLICDLMKKICFFIWYVLFVFPSFTLVLQDLIAVQARRFLGSGRPACCSWSPSRFFPFSCSHLLMVA